MDMRTYVRFMKLGVSVRQGLGKWNILDTCKQMKTAISCCRAETTSDNKIERSVLILKIAKWYLFKTCICFVWKRYKYTSNLQSLIISVSWNSWNKQSFQPTIDRNYWSLEAVVFLFSTVCQCANSDFKLQPLQDMFWHSIWQMETCQKYVDQNWRSIKRG